MSPKFRLLVAVSLCALTGVANAYAPAGRWGPTAGDPVNATIGNAGTMTWSIVPDGTWIESEQRASNLVSFLDDIWGAGPGGSDLTARPWFNTVASTFNRWGQLGGATLIYEPADDGTNLNGDGATRGVRGDIRMSGAYIDGASNTLAHNEFPSGGGDMVIDTSDAAYLGHTGGN